MSLKSIDSDIRINFVMRNVFEQTSNNNYNNNNNNNELMDDFGVDEDECIVFGKKKDWPPLPTDIRLLDLIDKHHKTHGYKDIVNGHIYPWSRQNESKASEISDIQWLTENECLQKIRDYHVSRHSIITKIFGFIKGLGEEYTISES